MIPESSYWLPDHDWNSILYDLDSDYCDGEPGFASLCYSFFHVFFFSTFVSVASFPVMIFPMTSWISSLIAEDVTDVFSP